MGVLSDEVYALAKGLVGSTSNPLIDMRVDVRQDAGSPDWHAIVWDGQPSEDDNGSRIYDGLGVLAVASGDDMNEVLTTLRGILTRRTEN